MNQNTFCKNCHRIPSQCCCTHSSRNENLAEVGKWMDEKGYELSTHEKQQEFARKRNYHYTNTDNPIDFPKCWCHTCRPITVSDMRMILCPDCGNKRCPKATDHNNPCTNSNEPGQNGSIY